MELIGIVSLIVLLIIGVFLVWTQTERGSEWRLKIRGVIDAGAKQEGPPQEEKRSIVQEQEDAMDSVQSASKDATSEQRQSGTERSQQIIE